LSVNASDALLKLRVLEKPSQSENSAGGLSVGGLVGEDCSNLWCRQEGHNKRSCRTANDSRISAQGEESDTETEVETDAEVIVVDIPMRRRGSRERRRRE
jgi:hypothetical protein